MALIKCPECKTEVSDKAPQCMKCGISIAKQNTTATIKPEISRWVALIPLKVNIYLGVGSQPVASCMTGQSTTITCVQPMDIIVEFDKRHRVAVSVEPGGTYRVGLNAAGIIGVKGFSERIL